VRKVFGVTVHDMGIPLRKETRSNPASTPLCWRAASTIVDDVGEWHITRGDVGPTGRPGWYAREHDRGGTPSLDGKRCLGRAEERAVGNFHVALE
jgi:hypothetical protein